MVGIQSHATLAALLMMMMMTMIIIITTMIIDMERQWQQVLIVKVEWQWNNPYNFTSLISKSGKK